MLKVTDKETLRRRFRQERSAVPQEQQTQRDNDILFRLLTLPEYRHCTAVFTYVSRHDEVSTRTLIQAAWANGKMVAVPRWQQDGTLVFFRVESWSQLKTGRMGILEPDDTCTPVTDYSADAICVVPGLSFDTQGYRLGYGKGCYDRFLPGFPGLTIGLCPASAMTLVLPREDTDQPVDMVITENYIRRRNTADQKAT